MSNSLEALKRIKEGLYDYALNQLYKKYVEQIEKDLELLETLKKIALGVGTEEDIAVARKHFEMEVKQLLEKSHEGYTIIQYPQENNDDR